jgi:RNA polymerase sigma-70 factor (ECF subfamily)
MGVYNTYTDGELVQLLQQGDEKAFRELYERYWDKLVARAFTQLASTEDAEELLHDIFIKLWQRRASLQLKYSFHTYIAAALKYEIIHKLAERKQRKPFTTIGVAVEGPADHSTQGWLDFRDLQDRLEASVSALPEQCQLVFRLSREQGLSEKEIAARLQLAPKTVQNHMTRALKKLKVALHQFFLHLL